MDSIKEFELTDMQYSFFISRSNENEQIRCCHAFFEFENENLDIERFKKAFEKVFLKHPMLRICIINGKQRILDKTKYNKINVFDLSNKCIEDALDEIKNIRKSLEYRVMRVEKGQIIGLTICLLPNKKVRIMYDIDLIGCDVQSFIYILQDISEIYLNKECTTFKDEVDFNDYIVKRKNLEQKNQKYWDKKILYMSNGPILPANNLKITNEFCNLSFELNKDEVEKLKRISKERKIKIEVLLLTVYIKVIAMKSKNKHFIINIPTFYRNTNIGNMSKAIGDFSDLMLLDVDCTYSDELEYLIKVVNKEFNEISFNQPYSGIKILRKLNVISENTKKAPIVFSYHVDPPLVSKEIKECFGELKYLINQTPGALIDFQIYQIEDKYKLCWIFPKDYFEESFITNIFNLYKKIIMGLINEQ